MSLQFLLKSDLHLLQVTAKDHTLPFWRNRLGRPTFAVLWRTGSSGRSRAEFRAGKRQKLGQRLRQLHYETG